MGIAVEFNPDLALRDLSHYKSGKRKKEECIPLKLEKGRVYNFLKSGQRNYWLEGELPLLKTEGNAKLSRPIASIKIIEATHTLIKGVPMTKGKYKVFEVFDINSPEIHFEKLRKAEKMNEVVGDSKKNAEWVEPQTDETTKEDVGGEALNQSGEIPEENRKNLSENIFNKAKAVLEGDFQQKELSTAELLRLKEVSAQLAEQVKTQEGGPQKPFYSQFYNLEWEAVLRWLDELYQIDLQALPQYLFDYRDPWKQETLIDSETGEKTDLQSDITSEVSGVGRALGYWKREGFDKKIPGGEQIDQRLIDHISMVREKARLP